MPHAPMPDAPQTSAPAPASAPDGPAQAVSPHAFRAPRWLPGGNLQTIWPALFSARHDGPPLAYRRERWDTPDADFIDVDWLGEDIAAPLLVLFHGLEGSSSSHYAQAFAHWARRHGWRYAVPHFRGCSGELNRAPRAYHSGDFEEIGWILQRMRRVHHGAICAVGISLGGNALLRWAEEAGDSAANTVRAVCAVSSPIDMVASGLCIGRGFNRHVYTRMFLNSMKPRALLKLAQYPGLFDRDRLVAARTLYEFDDVFTAPLHGFRNTDDYWTRGSSKPHLHQIRIPALVVNALNDPFVPAASLPAPHQVGRHVTLWQPAHGGHVGFPGGRWPGHVHHLPEAVMRWMLAHL
jgi:uncharacterized protein